MTSSVTSPVTSVLAIGGIASAHAVALERGATVVHVRTHAGHTALAADRYARVVDVSDVPAGVGQVDAVLHGIGDLRPDAMLCLHDESVELGALIAERLGLRFASPETTAATVDKSVMRDRLDAAGLGTVRHGHVVDGQVVWAGGAPAGPVVLKPGRGRASIGVVMLTDAVEADALVATDPAAYDGFVVEERVLGVEHSVESIVTSVGAWHGVTAKQTEDAIETGHVHPAPLDAVARDQVLDATLRALAALGVTSGLLHTEVILDGRGVAHVVETHLRGGGDGILDLILHATGLDLTALHVEDLLGRLDAMPAARDLGAASSQFSFPQDSGEVAGWVGLDEARQLPGVEGVGTIPDVGDVVGPDRGSSYSRLAWAVATGPHAVSARARARAAVETVQPVLVGTTSARELGPAGERS